MRILLTNDDGIDSYGLKVLEGIARNIGDDIWTVAPNKECSGYSRSLTLYAPLRLKKITPRSYALHGTPTDCVIMAIKEILPKDRCPLLVLSGVNVGQNIADDVTYSGTVGAALEGTAQGATAMALSQSVGLTGDKGAISWELSRTYGADIVKFLLTQPKKRAITYNINFPQLPDAKVKGVKIVSQGKRDKSLIYPQKQILAKKQGMATKDPHYQLTFERYLSKLVEGTDIHALYNGYITVTPLHTDLTNYSMLRALQKDLPSNLAAGEKETVKEVVGDKKTVKEGW